MNRWDATGVGLGLFFIAAGVVFLLDRLDVLTLRFGTVWPILLIGVGIAVLAGSFRKKSDDLG